MKYKATSRREARGSSPHEGEARVKGINANVDRGGLQIQVVGPKEGIDREIEGP